MGTDFTLYTFPGLKKQVPIPSWIKVVIPDPLPDGPNLTNHTPSSAFTKTTWHDTGNDTTKAADEYAWLKNGRPGGEPGDYSGIFDDTTIYITSRFDEDVWHAGTPEGNHTSYGFEQAFGGGVDFNKSLQVGAALHGGLIAALGWSVDTALVKHQYWYGKWCPGQILNKGIWSQVVAMVSDAALAAAAFLNGGTVPKDAPVYAKPVPIPELEKFKGKPDSAIPYRVEGGSGDNAWIAFYVGDRVQAIKATDRMRYSTGGEVIGAKLQPNEQFDVDWIITSKAGKYADVYYTPWATRIRAADCQRVSDVKAAA